MTKLGNMKEIYKYYGLNKKFQHLNSFIVRDANIQRVLG